MAAAESASQLEVADLIQDRAADGSLPAPVATHESSLQHNAACGDAAAAVVPSASKRKAVNTDQDEVEEAEGSQMRSAKRPRVEQGQGEQPHEAQEGPEGPSALNRSRASLAAGPPGAGAGADSNLRLSTVGIASPDQAVGTCPLPASPNTAGYSHTETAATAGGGGHIGSSSAATLDQLEQNHGRSSGQAGSGATLMAEQYQVGDLQELDDQHARGRLRSSSTVPNEETLQCAQPGSSTQAQPEPGTQTQPGSSAQSQAGPSTGLSDQDMQEDANPEMKEKREQARSRSRAWRKVLLDGLDLQIELTVTAAQALHPDSALAETEVKVGLVAGTI